MIQWLIYEIWGRVRDVNRNVAGAGIIIQVLADTEGTFVHLN
ncbi:hypothetical protein SAMN05421827_1322 [Pedobacter terrae]|uniref:Uncharacterized protein n=1 Tax=Pedobacter terrae TaxID=405671 RepID=A0A1G8DVT8_9SPHI|nr:hypothetical protein SAMN05421827_1322 [Pedobacter terrae]